MGLNTMKHVLNEDSMLGLAPDANPSTMTGPCTAVLDLHLPSRPDVLYGNAWHPTSGTDVEDWVCRGLRSIPPILQSFAWPVPVAAFVP